MAEAIKDQNYVPTLLGTSNADGVTTVQIYANSSGHHAMVTDDGLGGSDVGGTNDTRDANRVIAFMAVSATDGVTPIPVYADPATNALLVRSL